MNVNSFKSELIQVDLTLRYLPFCRFENVMKSIHGFEEVLEGYSVQGRPINSYMIGSGPTRVLMWSQMHGNESTSCKGLLDLMASMHRTCFRKILQSCTIVIVPMLNPDGANAYTRVNANGVDLNRDAVNLTQPESRVLMSLFDRFTPHFCFNLHDQRSIFGAGLTGFPAALSFLVPAADQQKTCSHNRAVGRSILGSVVKGLTADLSNTVSQFDDHFNINCFGDFFQSKGATTMLFEAGQLSTDYMRSDVRLYFSFALFLALKRISSPKDFTENADFYTNLPQNMECYCDVILQKVKLQSSGKTISIGLTYNECLEQDDVVFRPSVSHIDPIDPLFAFKIINDEINLFTECDAIEADQLIGLLESNQSDLIKNLTII